MFPYLLVVTKISSVVLLTFCTLCCRTQYSRPVFGRAVVQTLCTRYFELRFRTSPLPTIITDPLVAKVSRVLTLTWHRASAPMYVFASRRGWVPRIVPAVSSVGCIRPPRHRTFWGWVPNFRASLLSVVEVALQFQPSGAKEGVYIE